MIGKMNRHIRPNRVGDVSIERKRAGTVENTDAKRGYTENKKGRDGNHALGILHRNSARYHLVCLRLRTVEEGLKPGSFLLQ